MSEFKMFHAPLVNSLDELSVEDQKEVIDALTLFVNKMNKSL
ncbi:hypothetical protein TEHAL1_22460 [Tetragenococcus halophilus]|nr:hypothetical protein [Tetragenococcus halophilus]GFK25296.1 hypothetical protein YA163_23590 [Tetragenococcus halophilus]GMG64770.1 hypothetical protein TEHAL1_22460 [Tetragenococcus halophilus]GMG69289.1 hypothetical protein TEHMS4_22270 [Tetragenococcus halophilus]